MHGATKTTTVHLSTNLVRRFISSYGSSISISHLILILEVQGENDAFGVVSRQSMCTNDACGRSGMKKIRRQRMRTRQPKVWNLDEGEESNKITGAEL
jgi:hypothetical protein